MSTEQMEKSGAPRPRLQVKLAHSDEEVLATQRLRYRVFAEEMGAEVHTAAPEVEADRYDPHCQHLLVLDAASGKVVSSTRILTRPMVARTGGFYSQNEFDIDAILRMPGNFMEMGRTCVDPDFRSGAAIGMLWAGLAQFIELNRIDYLIGCASIPMQDGGVLAHGIMGELRAHHMAPDHLRVTPRRPLPGVAGALPAGSAPAMPPLLKAYLRVGAWACGEACWDPDFQVADVFVMLDVDNLQQRYVRHFLRGQGSQRPSYALAS